MCIPPPAPPALELPKNLLISLFLKTKKSCCRRQLPYIAIHEAELTASKQAFTQNISIHENLDSSFRFLVHCCILLTITILFSYEAVHPLRSLSDLKARLGKGRRCFAFFHPCLPEEPLVFVHVALLPEVAGSMAEIVNLGGGSGQKGDGCDENEVVGRGGDSSSRCRW